MRRDDDMDGGGEDRGDQWKTSREGPSGKMIGAGIAAALLLVFILQNTNEADINFLFWDGGVPLWILIAVSAALGLVIGWFFGRRGGRRAAFRSLD